MDFPSFPEVPIGYAAWSQLVYSHRYISTDILSPSVFQVFGGQLCITSFFSEEVRCLSLLILTISHNNNDEKHICFLLLYYVDSLVQEP